MKNFINHKWIICAITIALAMVCFCACTKTKIEDEPKEVPTRQEEPAIKEPQITEVPQSPSLTENEREEQKEEQITLEQFQAIVDAMMAEESSFFDRTKAEEAFKKVNETRRANGVAALAWEESLYDLACTRAEEIVTKFSHERLDGSYVGDVIIRQMGALGCGENIASNYQSVTNLVNGWMNSDGHRENLLNTGFYAGAVACYCHNGTYYWVNLFLQ
jgi:uncharacterized protein YkwD